MLDSRAIRHSSPPTRVARFLPDGPGLSWVVARLRKNDPARHAAWIEHLRTALPDPMDIAAVSAVPAPALELATFIIGSALRSRGGDRRHRIGDVSR